MTKAPTQTLRRPHDTTTARRQAKRRALFAVMHEALKQITTAKSLTVAQTLARGALDLHALPPDQWR